MEISSNFCVKFAIQNSILSIANKTILSIANKTILSIANKTILSIANKTILSIANKTILSIANKTILSIANKTILSSKLRCEPDYFKHCNTHTVFKTSIALYNLCGYKCYNAIYIIVYIMLDTYT